jgi:glycosyltransferase involved in cell wall biosynthesis
MSEHEGFCVPLLEAMAFGLPVLAYDAGAVSETLGGAGVLVGEKPPDVLAALVHRLVTDAALRRSVLEGQARRLEALRGVDQRALVLEKLAGMLSAPGRAR